jgi:hypothetical protein
LAYEAENQQALLAEELVRSPAHGSDTARVKEFVDQGGGRRTTFFTNRKLGGEYRRRDGAQ